MVTSGWGAWALSPRGLVLVICLSACLSQQPRIRPADCRRKEHPVVQYQGECQSPSSETRWTFKYLNAVIDDWPEEEDEDWLNPALMVWKADS